MNLNRSLARTQRNSKCLFFSVNHISEALPISMMISRRLPLHYLIYGMLLRNGLNPEFPDLPMSLQYG